MQFQLIDQKTWKRKEYFEHYFTHVPCTYSMTVNLAITGLKMTKKKVYPSLLYGLTKLVNYHEEFRMTITENGAVGIFSDMMPCYTVFHKETETFSNIWTEYSDNYTEFCDRYMEDLIRYGNVERMMAKPNPPVNTFPVSMIPWATFEGFNLNLQNGYDYLLPVFSFGKYYEKHGEYFIPLSIQVHHAVCDGFHICRFVNELQELINKLGE